MRSKYVYVIIMCGPVIVAPGIIAHMAGASLPMLARVARFQVLTAVALLVTALVSFALFVGALWRRDWKAAGDFAIALAVPALVWLAVLLSNGDGVDVALGHYDRSLH